MANIIIPQQNISEFTVTNSGSGQSVGTKTVTLQTKNTYVTDNIEVTVGGSVNVPAGTFSNQATSGATYTENTATGTVIGSEGYLYLNKGWFNNTKISLGHLIPDISPDTVEATTDKILSGYKAYDEDGTLMVGTIATISPSFTGGGLTVTGTVTNLTAPTVTCSPTGKFVPGSAGVGGTYGVTATAPSGSDGTDFLMIDATHTTSNGSVKAKGSATRAAVTYNGNTTGFVDKTDGTVALSAQTTATETTSGATSIAPTVTDDFKPLYIPIVKSIETTGGGVTKSSGTGSVTGTKPTMTLSYEGKFTDTASGGTATDFGIIEGVPNTGQDGTDYLKIKIGGSSNTQTWSGTATINYNRAAVTLSNSVKGAIYKASGTEVNAADSGSLTHTISGDVKAQLANNKTYSIPITSVSFAGGAISATAGGSVTTTPAVTYSGSAAGLDGSGNALTLSNYGVSSTTAGSTNGYITFTASGSATTTGVVQATADAHKNAVTYTNNAGAIKANSGTQAQAAADAKQNTKSITVAPTATAGTTTKYRIPIVSPKGTGGDVTISGSLTGTSVTGPTVEAQTSGSAVSSANMTKYGITATVPSGTDGETYITLKAYPKRTAYGSVRGTVSGTYTRGAVKADNTYRGAVNITTSTTLLDATNETSFTGSDFDSGNIDFTNGGDKLVYFTISTVPSAITGGGLSTGTAVVSGTGNISVTPKTNLLNRTGSNNGTAITDSTYAIQTTAPTTGTWVVIDPDAECGNSKTVSVSVPVSRADASVTITKGITQGGTSSLAGGSVTASGSGTVGTSKGEGTSKYIPVVTPTGSVDTIEASANGSATSKVDGNYIHGNTVDGLPTNVRPTATQPSDLNTYEYGYLVITPSISTRAGTARAKGKATIGAGITAGGDNVSDWSSCSVGVNGTSDRNKIYIKVYGGAYSVS